MFISIYSLLLYCCSRKDNCCVISKGMLLTVLFNMASDNPRRCWRILYCVCKEIGQNLTNLIFFAHIPSFWSFFLSPFVPSPCSSPYIQDNTHSRHILFYMLTQNPKIKFKHISFLLLLLHFPIPPQRSPCSPHSS